MNDKEFSPAPAEFSPPRNEYFCDVEYFVPQKDGMIFIAMNKKEIGAAIVERRDELRITQARLARVSGVSVHTLSNLETGDGNVTLDTLIKVATTIGYKIKVGV